MDRTLEDISANGPFKYFEHHIKYLNKFNDWVSFEAISETPTLNKVQLQLKKGEKSFYFNANDISTPENEEPVKYQNVGYGFNQPFKIFNEKHEFTIPNGVNIFNLSFFENDPFSGNITNLNTANFFNGLNYYRTIIPIEYKEHNDIKIYFNSNPVKIDNWSRFFGLLNIDGFDIFEYSFEQVPYFVIESTKLISFEEFKKYIEVIIHCYALISGNLYREELFLFSSNNESFKEIKGFAFQNIGRTIIENLTVIPQRFINATGKTNNLGETRLSSSDFNKIINKSIQEPELFRSIKLLTEAADLPLELKTSIYSVCLETVRNIVQEKNKEKLNPFKKQSDCNDLFVIQTKQILNKIPDNLFNNKESIVKKIDNINQLGNTESFFAIFKFYGIILTEDDKESIDKRNDFLHGRIPFDNEDELQYVADKLFQLVEYLILKICGYSGIVLNQANLNILLKGKELVKEKYILRQI